MRTLCFGGSFNPIHHGHLRTSRAVANGRYGRVMLIPSAQPPHKADDRDMAPSQHRLAMCRLAVADDPLFHISDIELKRSGPSYTIETARELRRQGWPEVHWLIGADQVVELPTWKQPLELLREVHFVIMARPGWAFDWSALPSGYRHLESQVVSAPLVEISASEIRRRVRARLPIDHLTPVPVSRYIQEHRLYQLGPTPG